MARSTYIGALKKRLGPEGKYELSHYTKKKGITPGKTSVKEYTDRAKYAEHLVRKTVKGGYKKSSRSKRRG